MLTRERPSKISNVFENFGNGDQCVPKKFKSCSSRGTVLIGRICFNPKYIHCQRFWARTMLDQWYARQGEENYSQSDLFRNSNRELHISSHLVEKETRLLTLDSLSLRMCFSSPVGESRKDLLNFELEFDVDGVQIFLTKNLLI